MPTTTDDERLESQQALLELRTLQRVAVELSRSLDLDVVLGRCLDLAMEVAHAVSGILYLADPARSTLRRVAVRNLSELVAPPTLPIELVSRALSASSVQLPLVEDPARSFVTAAWREGLRHVVMLALRLDHSEGAGELIGLLAVHFRDGSPLPTSTIQTLEAIARYEAMAIVNARTHQMAERRSRMAHGLREFSERALACSDDDELYRLIIDSALKLTGNDRGLISRVAAGSVRVVAAVGIDADLVGTVMPESTPYLARALAERGTVVQEDATGMDAESPIGRVILGKATRSFMHSVMRHGDRPVGVLFAGSGEPRCYEPEECEALQILAAVAGEAMERVSALERLAEEKRRLDAVLEHLPIIVSVLGPDGEVLHANAAGRAATAWIGQHGSDWRNTVDSVQLLDRDGRPVAPEDSLMAQAFRGEQPPPREMTVVTSDGTRRYLLSVAAPLLGRDGKVEAVVTGSQDVTSLREMADAKDHFLRIASHELRSPLTALRASTSLLEMDPAAAVDGERRSILLLRVQRQVDRLTRLVEQLLDSVRLNATEPALELVETDLLSLCQEAISALPEKERVTLDADGPALGRWDPLRLEQVLNNLLSNAARYSAGAIVVRLRSDGVHAVVEVSDRGIGIPPDQRKALFTPFFRASNAALQSRGGLGLGLHIAHEIVRRHGGSLGVRSTLGEGSTFIVELPVDRAPPAG